MLGEVTGDGVFDFSASPFAIPVDIPVLFHRTWMDLATTGVAWTGAQRVDVARVARAARLGDGGDAGDLPEPAADIAARVAAAPSSISKSEAERAIDSIGEPAYVELVGVVACLVAIDTYTSLVGEGRAPFPQPQPGSGETRLSSDTVALKRRGGWVATAGPRGPHHALSAVPGAQAMVSRLLDRLYIDRGDIGSLGPVRGLSRPQLEFVILTVSHGNECFY